MVMRIGGLASGMDIDALVEKLMLAERAPLNKLQQKKQSYEWTRDAYRDVNTKIKTLDSYIADNLILKSLNTKVASSTNSDLVSATATSSATGNLSIEGVSKLAKSARAVSTEQINATSNTKLSSLGFTASSISFKAIQSNGEMASTATEIKYDSNTTVGQLVSKINSSNAGVSAVFENGRLSITAKNTGENKLGDAEILVTSGIEDFKKLGFSQLNNAGELATDGSNAKFVVNGIATERSTNTLSINGYNVTLKKTFNEDVAGASFLQAAENNEQFARTNLQNFITQASGLFQDLDLNAFTTLEEKSNAITAYLNGKISTKSQEISSANNALNQSKEAVSTSDPNKTIGQLYNGLSSRAKELMNSPLTIPSSIDPDDPDAAAYEELEALGSDLTAVQNVHDDTKALTTLNSELNSLNNQKTQNSNLLQSYTKADNTLTDSQASQTATISTSTVTLSSTNNIDDTMKKIKEFVDTYNGFIKDLTGKTKESKYRDYAPLTTEQREEMSEDEIKLWEEKAKSGLLRSDALVRNGLSNMRSLIYQSNPAIEDKRFNTLYSIGITTSSNYNDGGTLEIDETKLRKALEENPNAVEQLLKSSTGKKDEVIGGKKVDTRGYLEKLRESMKALEVNIESKAGRASMTDAQFTIGKNLMDTETRIKSWQTKLESIEERYWKQFTAMESAINKANQQSSMFTSGQ
jgi:flagellar hook-associated protein 2